MDWRLKKTFSQEPVSSQSIISHNGGTELPTVNLSHSQERIRVSSLPPLTEVGFQSVRLKLKGG